jgi:poly-gamma-glutamate synthase PgsB/CapB
MNVVIAILIIVTVLALLGILEHRLHLRNVRSIPIRIHVNGTRGKSSVTRLIAAGLRAHGIRTFAKTTGSLPRVITHSGTEYPVYRPAKPNIIEQIRIVSFAAKAGAEALVIECMALRPQFQVLTELKLIQATHGVITNAREDHLDVMGPTERDVALALLGSTPVDAKLFTAERDYLDEFGEAASDRCTELVVVDRDEAAEVTDQELERFSYVEHKDNVALALRVCQSVGVDRETALSGMWSAHPDIGAMAELAIHFFGRHLVFVNGFAANDPESTERIWRMALDRHPDKERRIMVVNTRADRPDRSKQLGEAIPEWPEADSYVVIGTGTYFLVKAAVAQGLPASRFVFAENKDAERIFEELLGLGGRSALVMGIGNIAGPGLELITFFKNRSAFT